MEKIPNIEEWKMKDRELQRIKELAGLNEEKAPQYMDLTDVPLSQLGAGIKNNFNYAKYESEWDNRETYRATLAGVFQNLKKNEARIQQLESQGQELAAILQILQDGYGGAVGQNPTATAELAFVQEAMKQLSRLVG